MATSLSHVSIYLLSLFISFPHSSCSNPSSDISRREPVADLPEMSFSQSVALVEMFDFVEIEVWIPKPTASNPFTEVLINGSFGLAGRSERLVVDGFCDSPDGSVFRIRFTPMDPGEYVYTVTYWQDNLQKVHSGKFKAIAGKRRGFLQVDTAFPWHFVWTGTKEHYFLNGTTAFLLMGWDDEKVIHEILDRLSSLDVNRVRVLLDGRSDHFWTEPIKPGRGFHAHLNPWVASRPDSVADPGFDYGRFNIQYWQKFERMLKDARARNVIISVVLGWNDTRVHPSAGSEDERRFLRYAVARLASFPNITWDLGDDLDGFRTDAWTHETGMFLYHLDPYHHLATSHPMDNRHQDRSASWFGMTSFQQWNRPLHAWILEQRAKQTATGRIIPQVNEEYGYEDHYPEWAPHKDSAYSAEANRRAAWEMAMAGGYQTTGESAKRGTGMGPDSGGGWVNGRGDDTMIMLKGYAHLLHFFTSFEWWKADPHDELVNSGAFCLAEPGSRYVIYLPNGGSVTVRLDIGRYGVKWFNPRTGEYSNASVAEGPAWTSSPAPDEFDWVILLTRSPH